MENVPRGGFPVCTHWSPHLHVKIFDKDGAIPIRGRGGIHPFATRRASQLAPYSFHIHVFSEKDAGEDVVSRRYAEHHSDEAEYLKRIPTLDRVTTSCDYWRVIQTHLFLEKN